MNEMEFEVKEFSKNAFIAFFQKIGRTCSLMWTKFSNKHPKLAKLLYEFFMFWIFSMMVTIFQYIVMTFLPYAFGIELAGREFLWPGITINIKGYQPFKWSILGYDVQMIDGVVKIGGGLGYFIAYELATFLAQVINFPLQRNITYKSKGNPYFQAMWFFIAWVLISLFCNAITSFWIGWANQVLPAAIYSILTTIITGGVSMVVFFFVNKIIFPDLQKESARLNKKVEVLRNKNCSKEKLDQMIAKALKVEHAAKLELARKKYLNFDKIANSKITKYYVFKDEFVQTPTDENSKQLKMLYEETKKAVEEKNEALKEYNYLKGMQL